MKEDSWLDDISEDELERKKEEARNDLKKSVILESIDFDKSNTKKLENKESSIKSNSYLSSLSKSALEEARKNAKNKLLGIKEEKGQEQIKIKKTLDVPDKKVVDKRLPFLRKKFLGENEKQDTNKETVKNTIRDKILKSQNKNVDFSTIRTLRRDLVKSIKRDNLTLAQIAVQERTRLHERKQQVYLKNQKEKTIKYLILILIFFILSGGIIASFIVFKKNPNEKLVKEINPEVIIFSEKESFLDLSNTSGISSVSLIEEHIDEINISHEEINHIVFISKFANIVRELSISEFFLNLNIRPKGNLERYLDSTYMFGIYDGNIKESFFILKTISFEQAYQGMSNWEDSMALDIGFLFDINKNTNASWSDITIKNINARSYSEKDGEIIFIYAFFDKNTIVITKSDITLTNIHDRFTTPKETIL